VRHTGAQSDRTLRDGSFEVALSRHFVPGYDRTVPPELEAKPLRLRGNKSSQTSLNFAPFGPGFQPWETQGKSWEPSSKGICPEGARDHDGLMGGITREIWSPLRALRWATTDVSVLLDLFGPIFQSGKTSDRE
jgi:hypothetical protein